MQLSPEILLLAYGSGLFPMAESRESAEIRWFAPDPRCVMPLDERFHVSRTLQRRLRQRPFEIRSDTAFEVVMRECAAPRPESDDTWISEEIIDAYTRLHDAGCAHSVECWRGDVLVGGLYGVALGGAFFGESMFSRVRDASKVALVALVERLRGGGYVLLDVQFYTPHLGRFGACEIPRDEYVKRLAAAIDVDADWNGVAPEQAVRR